MSLGDPADPDLTVDEMDVTYSLAGPWNGRPALPFQTFGFPHGYKDVGQHAIGTMTGGFGPRGQWVQLDGVTDRGARITRGYSGALCSRGLQAAVSEMAAEFR